MRFFAALASTNARRRKFKEKKDDLPLAIGKNYINKNVSFLLTFYLYMFLLIANRKESEKIVTEKEDKRLPHIYPLLLFIFFLREKG